MNSPRAKSAARGSRLAARRAFVVQLDEEVPARRSDPVSGLVENIATGEQSLFDSLDDLESFMRRSLASGD